MAKQRQNQNPSEKGDMTVRQAGQKGGEATRDSHGHEFYEEIGQKGGQRVRELVDEGKQSEGTQSEMDEE